MNHNTVILLWLFRAMRGITPWQILTAYRIYLHERITHDRSINDHDVAQRWENLYARLPVPPIEEVITK